MTLTIDAPTTCPQCGSDDICFEYSSGEPFADLHCGKDDRTPGLCGWRVTHFVGIGEPFVVVTRDAPTRRN